MSGCRHQFIGEAVCEHCGIYEHAHLVEKIERLTRERDEARRELAALERLTGRFIDPREEDALREANEALAQYEESLANYRALSKKGDT